MWLRDSLPKDVAGIRCIIYGYDSALDEGNSFQSIEDLAVSFIRHLKTSGWTAPSSKPLIILGHSLGGIILRKALIYLANSG